MDRKKFKEGVALFNSGRFFEAHEAWEEIWLKNKESLEGQFLIGLIQYTAFLLKFKQNQIKPALTLEKNALSKLEKIFGQKTVFFGISFEAWFQKANRFFEKRGAIPFIP